MAVFTKALLETVDQLYQAGYFAHFCKLNPLPHLRWSIAPGQVVRESHLIRRESLEQQPIYQEWLKRASNYTHGANLTLARESGSLARLSFQNVFLEDPASASGTGWCRGGSGTVSGPRPERL